MIDVTKLKNRWLGEWDPQYQYKKNDVVQWKGSTYVCLRDLPLDYISVMDNSVSTSTYSVAAPGIYIKTKDPSDAVYWLLFAPGTNFKDGWAPFRRYERGDVVDLAGDIYVCILAGRNIYPLNNTTNWTLMFQAADRDRRNYAVQTWNQNPIGWQYNLGGRYWSGESGNFGYRFGYIDVEGNANYGGYKGQGCGLGTPSNGYTSYGWYQPGFIFGGWLDSTQNGGSGRLTTPDGEAPKIIQWLHTADDYSIWLMNNGEVYTAGFNSQYQMGNNTTTVYAYPVRVYATETTDWLGSTIPYTFANSKIVKVHVSSLGASSAPSCFAIDDQGHVWAWGYNAYGQLGLGSDNTSSGSVGNAQTNVQHPRMLPRSYFNGRKIVDIMGQGNNAAGTFALDEDGQLWAWGCEGWGEMGLGQRTGSVTSQYSFFMTPRLVNIDWAQHGGLQKLQCMWYGGTNRWTIILDGEGKLWIGGITHTNVGGQDIWSSAYGTGNLASGHFQRLNKGWFRDHEIDNFWCVGDARGWTMYLRERGTGITYSLGSNQYGTLGQGANHNYWWNSGGFKIDPGRVEGVYNLVDAWNNGGGSQSTDTSYTYITAVLLTETGELWGQGQNSYGSLAVGFSGNSYLPIDYADQTHSYNLFQKIYSPDGYTGKFIGGLGWGQNAYDGAMYLTDTGKCMIAGFDGTTGYQSVQGQYWALRYYQSAISDPGGYHRYHMHGYHAG